MDRMTPPTSLQPDSLSLALDRELRPGERVVWQQRQIARIAYKGFALYAFAIPWTAFAIFWTVMASAGASSMQEEAGTISWAFPLFGVPFILVGLGMMSAPFLPLFNKGKVLYAVTTERVLKVRLGREIDVESVPARRIGHIKRSERRDGSGSLRIAVGVGKDSDGDRVTEYFEIGEVADVISAHDHIAAIGKAAAQSR